MEHANKKKKKLILLMLVFLVPVLLLFYTVFSVRDKKDNANSNPNGFNDKLPSANAKESGKNKLEIYMQAERDSAKLKDQEKQDPYVKKWFDPTQPEDAVVNNNSTLDLPPAKFPMNKEDVNEKKVNDRIDKLMEALNHGNAPDNFNSNYSTTNNPLLKNDEQIEKIEKMLAGLQNTDTAGDPEMKQLESMLDKILDIQHPERVKERLQNTAEEPKKDSLNYAVSNAQSGNHSRGIFTSDISNSENAFWGLSSAIVTVGDNQTFLAVIHENQKITDDQTVKLRLLQNVFINNIPVPKGAFLFGKCKISGGRALLSNLTISYNNQAFPVQLTAYDQTDGMEGIYIQGDASDEVSKDGMDRLIQQMQLNTMTSSIGVQAATSGMQTAKNLLSKKVKKISVTLKAGHTLLLKPVQL